VREIALIVIIFLRTVQVLPIKRLLNRENARLFAVTGESQRTRRGVAATKIEDVSRRGHRDVRGRYLFVKKRGEILLN
jgi:hypothetical protein